MLTRRNSERRIVMVSAAAVVVGLLSFVTTVLAAPKDICTTIQSGKLLSSSNLVIPMGYMENGYNYQAHLYNGDYFGDGSHLIMKWNDAWLSNKDCDGDFKLDRPMKDGQQYYYDSGAWLTNHWSGEYEGEDGLVCTQKEFIKIVALPAEDEIYFQDGYWYMDDGTQIGESIWGQFAIVQHNWYDSCDPEGSFKMHEAHPGLGNL